MSNGRCDQIFWTKQLLELSGSGDTTEFNHLRQRWWFNPLSRHSLRLTKSGFDLVTTRCKIQCYSHELVAKIRPRTMLQLEKYFNYPYYIKDYATLKIFDQTTSVTLTLYNNNLQIYLDHIQKSI